MKVLIRTIQEDPPSLQTYRHEQQDHRVRASSSSRKASRGDGGTSSSAGAGDTDAEAPPHHYEPSMPHPSPDEFTTSFEAFVDACLQKDPAKRPSCADLLQRHLIVDDEHDRAERRRRLVEQVLNVVPTVGEGKVSSRSRAPSRQHRGSAAGVAATPAAASAADASSSSAVPPVPAPLGLGQLAPSSSVATSSLAPPPDSIPEAVRDRQPGTTWVFADETSSQQQQIDEDGEGHANTSLDRAALLEEDEHDVLQALDEFERQTGGENYYGREAQSVERSMEAVNEEDETIRAKPGAAAILPPGSAVAVHQPERYGDEGDAAGASAASLVSPPPHRTDSKDNNSTDEDLSAFMDEFELNTAGEDFRREA
jgi:serine/threonine protein kinase